MNPTTRIVRGIREVLLPLAILLGFSSTIHFIRLAWTVTTHAAPGQNTAAVAIEKERHHVLLLQNDHIRVFALTLPPGAQSFVQHEHNYLTIQIEEHEVIMWKDGESAIQHFRLPVGEIRFLLGGSALGVRNDSNAEYRNVTVEFLDPQVTTYGYRHSGQYDYGPNVTGPPVDPEGHFVNSLDLEKAVARDVQLLPGESLPAAAGPQLLVAVTQLEFSASTDHTIAIKPGDFMWRKARAAALPSASKRRMRLAVIEFTPIEGK